MVGVGEAAEPIGREGLPPCIIRYAQYGDRVAIQHQHSLCQWPDYWDRRDGVTSSTSKYERHIDETHPFNWLVTEELVTRPPEEWPDAEQWVRDG